MKYLLSLVISALLPVLSFADTHYVSLNGANNSPYLSWADAATNIQYAIDAAGGGDTVLVSNGVYEVGGLTNYPSNTTVTNRVVINKAITVMSANNDPTNTIIRGASPNGPAAVRCVFATQGSLIGFTLTNGATMTAGVDDQRRGGGVYSRGGCIVSNCILTGNSGEYGGGTYDSLMYIYYHGTACYWRPWPSPPDGIPYALRACTVYPVCLGLATLPRDRFAFATTRPGAEGVLTTHSVELPAAADLWLNADGDGVYVMAVDDGENELAHGYIGEVRSQSVYRNVRWKDVPPMGAVRLRITLGGSARLYSLKVEK